MDYSTGFHSDQRAWWENMPVVQADPAKKDAASTPDENWWQKLPVAEQGQTEAPSASSVSELQPKKADALDLFNYQVADKTNTALQGLFRVLGQTGLPESWRFDDMADGL